MQFDRRNDPNAARLIESLRYLGYGNYEAIADLVDNSIDADAPHIRILVHQRHGEIEIAVVDDGTGMDFDTLDEAMKLGSNIERDLSSDLGKFGMGLVTASLSIARRCHVITRGVDGCWSSVQDVDEVIDKNDFVKHLGEATKDEIAEFERLNPAATSGTAVILTKCDHITNRNTTHFAANLRSHLGRVHRSFISAGREIKINDETVAARDPLQLNEAEIVLDELIPVKVSADGSKFEENVRVRIALVPEASASELDLVRSLKNQGFYVMRNLREVIGAHTLNYFSKHNDFNRMRGEIFFPATLDKLVGIEFTKRQVNFDQSLDDQLAEVLVPICRSIKRREATWKRTEMSDIQKQVHRQSERAIAEKDKLLLKPLVNIEKRASRSENSKTNGAPEKKVTKRARRNFGDTQQIESRLNAEFREEKLGPNGQVYEQDMEGRKLVIRYNIEHPFYQHFLVDTLGNGTRPSATDFLIYCMAAAERRVLDDGDFDAVNTFKAVWSSNLRTLLN